MPDRVLAVRCIKTWPSAMGIYRCLLNTLMGYPSYPRNPTCALPSPSPFHYVMAKIVLSMRLAAYTKNSTLNGRSYGCTLKFSAWWVASISLSYGATLRAPSSNIMTSSWCIPSGITPLQVTDLLVFAHKCCHGTSPVSVKNCFKKYVTGILEIDLNTWIDFTWLKFTGNDHTVWSKYGNSNNCNNDK